MLRLGCLLSLLSDSCVVSEDPWHWCIGSSILNLEPRHENVDCEFAEALRHIGLILVFHRQVMGRLGMQSLSWLLIPWLLRLGLNSHLTHLNSTGSRASLLTSCENCRVNGC